MLRGESEVYDKNDKSKLPIYAARVVAIIVTLAVCTCILIFLTNGVIEVDSDSRVASEVFDKTSVTTLIEEIKRDEEEPMEEDETPPPELPPEASGVAFFGDSISSFSGVTNFNVFYPQGDVTDVHQTWWQQVVDRAGLTYIANSSSSGSFVTNNGDYYALSQERLDALPETAESVYVFMGMNDYWDAVNVKEFEQAYVDMLNAIKERCTMASVYCLSLYKTGFEVGRKGNKVSSYNTAIKTAANLCDCGYINLSVLDMSTMTLEADVSVHPTAEGMTAIADVILGVYQPPVKPKPEPPLPGIPDDLEKEDTPECKIDFVNETITGLKPGKKYTLNGTVKSANATGEIYIPEAMMGTTVDIVKCGNNIDTSDSDPAQVTIPSRPDPPSGYSKTNETAAGANDGTITGLTGGVEWQMGHTSWNKVSGSSMSGLEPGVYKLRKFAVAGASFKSKQVSVIIVSYEDANATKHGLTGAVSGWYEDIASGIKKASVVGSLGRFELYDGLPWDPDSGCYAYYAYKAKNDIYDIFSKAGINRASGSSTVINSNGAKLPANGGVIDGVSCMGVSTFPAMLDRGYFPDLTFKQAQARGDSSAGKGITQLAVILVPKGVSLSSTKDYLFLPAIKQDAKAHTFYGGVAQTNITVLSENKVQLCYNWDGSPTETVSVDPNDDLSKTLKMLNDKLVANRVVPNLSMGVFGNNDIETYWLDSASAKELNNNYTVVGFVVWPTTIK